MPPHPALCPEYRGEGNQLLLCRARQELARVQNRVADLLPAPSVGDVDLPVLGLDDGRIGVFAAIGFEVEDLGPVAAVAGGGNAQRTSAAGRVVVDEQGAAVVE